MRIIAVKVTIQIAPNPSAPRSIRDRWVIFLSHPKIVSPTLLTGIS